MALVDVIEPEHRIRAAEVVHGGYVITCACGWRSKVLDSDEISDVWDRHIGQSRLNR